MKIIINQTALILATLFLATASAPAAIFTNLYIFSADAFAAGANPVATNSDGVNPDGFVLSGTDGGNPEPLILSDGALYGMTLSGIQGVGGGDGAVFALTLIPVLNIQLINDAVVLTWDDPSFFLYSAGTVNGAYANISGAASPYTNAVIASQQYFELQ